MVSLNQVFCSVVLLSCVGLSYGNNSESRQYPFQASLRRFDVKLNEYVHRCSAVILSQNFVLSIDDCVYPLEAKFLVYVDSVWREDGVAHQVKRSIFYTDYNKKTTNRVVLIELVNPIQFSETVAAINLSRELIKGGVEAITVGWTGPGWRKLAPTQLQNYTVVTLLNGQCRNDAKVDQLCAKLDKKFDQMYLDDGSPLIYLNKLVGVKSDDGSSDSAHLAVFDRISECIDWIDVYTTSVEKNP